MNDDLNDQQPLTIPPKPTFPVTHQLAAQAKRWIDWANDYMHDQEDEIRSLRYELEQLTKKYSDLLLSKRVETIHHYHHEHPQPNLRACVQPEPGCTHAFTVWLEPAGSDDHLEPQVNNSIRQARSLNHDQEQPE